VIEAVANATGPGSTTPGRAHEHDRIRAWLHDGPLQALDYIAAGGYGAGADPSDLLALAARAANDLRDFIEHLGDVPETVPLAEGLRGVVAEARLFAQHQIELVIGPCDGSAAGPDAAALAAAAREALTNARKHARARRVVVYCEERLGAALVSVKDNGMGLEPSATPGLGVHCSICDRLESRGGSARIEGTGSGTLVTLTVGGWSA
jgi:signal transduction histidine kinase